jgi:hypothetical protein
VRTRKMVGIGVGVVGLLGVVLPAVRAEEVDPNKSPALCSDGNNPEPGMQGEVPQGETPAWNCGVTVVGSLVGANGDMAVAGSCAYTGSSAGVRVIDVSNPQKPKETTILETSSRELLAARITKERGILVTRRREPLSPDPAQAKLLGQDMLVDVWDIRKCNDPQLLGTLRFPTASSIHGDPPGETGGPVHNLTLNKDATKVYGTIPLQVGDISNLADPSSWTVKDLHCGISNQHYPAYEPAVEGAPALPVCETLQGKTWTMPSNSHEAVFNPDNSRLYIGSQIPGPSNNAMYILDMENTDDQGNPRLVSVTEQAPGHSIDLATIDGQTYLLHSNEIGGTACIPEEVRPKYVGMGDRAWLTNITNEALPGEPEAPGEPTSEIILAASRFENCGTQLPTGPSTAYHEVNDPLDSIWAVIGFGSAGFRIFDIRDPKNPTEVAYFNFGSSEHTNPYIIPGTNQMWVSGAGGFWVLELEPQVLEHLGLACPDESNGEDKTCEK